MSAFNLIQTFYVNPELVANVPEVHMTSVDVFFKRKPAENVGNSGSEKPGVTAWICKIESNDTPRPGTVLRNSIVQLDYDQISTSTTASVATNIGFSVPVLLETGKFYGIVLKFEDPSYEIFVNKQGDNIIGGNQITANPSAGSENRFNGNYYTNGNSGDLQKLSDRDLKFKVNVARYTANTITIPLVNKHYEFFTIDNTDTGAFVGGEYVYQIVANATGTITTSTVSQNVVGIGTDFENECPENTKIVVTSGGTDKVLEVVAVTNSTHMTVDQFPPFSASGLNFKVPPLGYVYKVDYTENKLILVDSNANSTNMFAVGNVSGENRLVGEFSTATANIVSIDRQPADNFKPTFLVGNPTGATYTVNYALANSSNTLSTTSRNLSIGEFNESKEGSFILSRSLEVNTSASGTLFDNTGTRKSAVANVVITITTPETERFNVPYLRSNELDFFFYQNDINNVYTETREVAFHANGDSYALGSIAEYDTETDRNGLATTKYISKTIPFKDGKYAEDIRVFLTGYRPAGTQIKVYAKIHNAADNESFANKAWTPLELKDNVDQFSSDDPNNLYEYTYGFAQNPDVQTELSGTASVNTDTANVIPTTTDHSNNVVTGDLIRLRDSEFGTNEVFVVSTANSTTISTFRDVSVFSTNTTGLVVDKLKYRNTAWNNPANDNVVRYVNSGLVEFDTYSSMQIKIVLLAEQSHIVPKVEQVQVIGVSS